MPNDLRRTHARWLRRGGGQPADLAPIMGHADSRMVERAYGKVTAVDLAPRLAASLAMGRIWSTTITAIRRRPRPALADKVSGMDLVFWVKVAVFVGAPCFAIGWAIVERRTMRRLREKAGIDDEGRS